MERLLSCLNFAKDLIPVVIQDIQTRQVLTLAYMNPEALQKTLETGKIHVFRRSKGRVMMKGETSGMVQEVCEVRVDCANNSLLFLVRPRGPGCHEGYPSCYFRRFHPETGEWTVEEEREFDPQEVYGKREEALKGRKE
jgi:phosphoribosyl-AMP cyclohydrolase